MSEDGALGIARWLTPVVIVVATGVLAWSGMLAKVQHEISSLHQDIATFYSVDLPRLEASQAGTGANLQKLLERYNASYTEGTNKLAQHALRLDRLENGLDSQGVRTQELAQSSDTRRGLIETRFQALEVQLQRLADRQEVLAERLAGMERRPNPRSGEP